MWILVNLTDKVSDDYIKNLESNICLYQKWFDISTAHVFSQASQIYKTVRWTDLVLEICPRGRWLS